MDRKREQYTKSNSLYSIELYMSSIFARVLTSNKPLAPLDGDLAAPQPRLVEVAEAVHHDGNRQGNGEHPEQGRDAANQLAKSRHGRCGA